MGDNKSQKKKKKKQRKTKTMVESGMDEAKQLPSAVVGGSTFADEWADGLVVHGPFMPQVVPVVAVDPFPDVELEGPVKRILKAHASRERSPHGRSSSKLPIAGGSYVLRGLEPKPMLNGAKVEVIEFHKARDRWSVRLESGVVLCVKPEVLVEEVLWQALRDALGLCRHGGSPHCAHCRCFLDVELVLKLLVVVFLVIKRLLFRKNLSVTFPV
jgi:hypothetical protein